ncbi:c-type cytochrome biogenesis protein CcmI [Porticoccus sp. W117]|uniref:c-type cytochrome biogenesis protein CcmI n=1 Tax=Porticoccus sp. W117 TaxID=3054777 RepID=UPI002592C627|nr:c-type cytochrome biogenesis protein CcmI [Porticoccus sp. W117]MDM3870250.1 c-type cytochrome biogenesis protein CcmI [Porticoccus sp. W117]
MAELWWPLAALVVLALLFVCFPLLRPTKNGPQVQQSRANAELFQEHLAELESQHQQGQIDDAELAALRAELERSLLVESQNSGSQAASKAGKPLWLMLSLVVALPVVALWLYLELGASDDLTIVDQLERSSLMQSQGHPEALPMRANVLERIEQRLLDQPDNFYYWVLSGRLNTEQEQLNKALAAYRRADELSGGQDITLMREYLQVAFALRDQVELAELKSLTSRILQQVPDNLAVLGLNGRIAFEEGDFPTAVRDWRKVLQALPPQHATAQQLKAELAKAEAGLTPEQRQEQSKGQLQLVIKLAPELELKPNATLFVIARPAGQTAGPPLAVKRILNANLPVEVILDDSNLMLPDTSLSQAGVVTVTARISYSGGVKGQSGDLQGQQLKIPVGTGKPAHVLIDRQL